jgi:putative ABC transport system permease protein
LVLLAAVTPLFVATGFRPSWWQTLLAAGVGSGLGQVALWATRGRRVAEWSVAVVAVIIIAVAGAWSFTHTAGGDESSDNTFLIVRSGNSSLTWDDVKAIKTQIPSVDLAVPYARKMVQLTTAEANWNTPVVGTTPDYFDLVALRVADGTSFDAASESAKVVVLGETVVARLYGASQSPVGEVVRVKNQPFTIIGVLAHQGMSAEGQDLDDVAIMPIGSYASKIERTPRFGGAVLTSARSREDLAHLEAALRSLLRDRHRLAPGDDDDFIIRSSNPH